MIDEDLKDLMQWQTIFFHGDRLIAKRPVWLKSATLRSGAAVTLKLIDGGDTGGEAVLDLETHQFSGILYQWDIPIYFSKGLYADWSAANIYVTLQYRLA